MEKKYVVNIADHGYTLSLFITGIYQEFVFILFQDIYGIRIKSREKFIVNLKKPHHIMTYP